MNLRAMAPDKPDPAPKLTSKALAEQQARLEREAAALRANLRKRKEQARARQDRGADREPP